MATTCEYRGPQDFKLIPQEKTFVYEFNNELDHNSTWDSTMGPDGKLYMSLSSELKDMGFARLYEYDYKTNSARKLIDVEDLLAPSYRALRPSKFHTSISFMNDGRLAMTTHSTDKGPSHPTWMPFAYYGHMWEGFSGSTIVAYDFNTARPEIIGVPAPRESLYTSCYDKKYNAFYSLGYMRGHLYRYDFDTRRVKDLGKVTEGATFRICPGPDGNLYTTTKSGWLLRIDTEAQKVIDMNVHIGSDEYHMCNFSEGRIGPDNKLYVALHDDRCIYAIDVYKGEVTNMGRFINTDVFSITEVFCGIFGMSFDNRGRLWYVVDTLCAPEVPGSPDGLYCWDITKEGSRPEFKGIVGVPGRITACVSGLFIHDNHLLIVDQNHGHAATAVYVIDMSQFDEPGDNRVAIDPEKQGDRMYHSGDPEVTGYNDPFTENARIVAQNPYLFDAKLAELYRVWRQVPSGADDSAVKAIEWNDDGTLIGLCGNESEYVFCIKDKQFQLIPVCEADVTIVSRLRQQSEVTVKDAPQMPHYPGRQYEAVPVVEAPLNENRRLIGTEDGFLAVVDGEKAFSLGMCGYNGPIRAMSSTPDKKTVYGTAGDEDDLGMVFRYSDDKGLELLGCIMNVVGGASPIFGSNTLSCCKINNDGTKLAIASADRMGTVYIYDL